MAESGQRLATDVEADVLGAGRLQARDQPTAGRHHDRAMAGVDQRLRDLQGGAFDTPGFQRGQQLDDGQAAHRSGGLPADRDGAISLRA